MTTTSYSFNDIVDFTRTTSATYVNSSGLLTSTPASKNLLTYSQSFTNWTVLRSTITPNIAIAPNGQRNASLLTDNSENSNHIISLTPTGTLVGNIYTFSVYAKKNTYPYVTLNFYSGSNICVTAVYNLNTGAVTQTLVGTSTSTVLISTNMTDEGSGWYRLSITGAFTNATVSTVTIGFAGAATGNTGSSLGLVSYSGNGTNSFYIWGAQLEATSYNNLILGAERVVGGNFESGLVGGPIQNGGTPTSVSTYTLNTTSPISGTQDGLVTITTAAVGAYPRITNIPSATKTTGAVYLLSFDYKVLSGAMVIELIYNGSSTTATLTTGYTGTGKFQCLYTARGTTANEGIYFGNSLCSVQIDNISVKQVSGATPTTTSYTKNYGGVYPPRFDYDPVTLQPRGLLAEDQRTNQLIYSEDFTNVAWSKTNVTVTPASAISPAGTTTATKLEASTTAATSVICPTVTISGTSASFSVFVKQGTGATVANSFALRNFTTSTLLVLGTLNFATGVWTYTTGSTGVVITNAGNGWWRVQISATSGITSGDTIRGYCGFVGGTSTAGDYLLAWGAQLEAGAFSSSYIPTTTSSVSRSPDITVVYGTNFSSFYNKTEGTFIGSGDAANVAANSTLCVACDSSGQGTIERSQIRAAISSGQLINITGGVSVASITSGAFTNNTVFKVGGGFKVNNFAVSGNGATIATDTSGGMPNPTELRVGRSGTGGESIYGHIRNIKYYPTRLTNAQIQALATL